MPGLCIPENVRAEPDVQVACRDATILVFVVPHQARTHIDTYIECALFFCYSVSRLQDFSSSGTVCARHLSTNFEYNSTWCTGSFSH
jgi:NAD-dependent glycerol-3-phosphate dehydrogenase N-terminus